METQEKQWEKGNHTTEDEMESGWVQPYATDNN